MLHEQSLPKQKTALSCVDAVVRRALIHARKTGGSVAMLLNLRSLCNSDRTPRFQRCPPIAIYVLDDLTCRREAFPKLLVLVKVMTQAGHDPARKLWVQAIDVDRLAALMC